MDKETIENQDSQNLENEENFENENQDDNSEDVDEDVETLRQKNQSLYAQLKKAKGFIKDENGQWVKKPETKQLGKKPEAKSDEFDYGQKAYLTANGIKGDEIQFAKDELKKFGGELDELIENDYFQSKLKDYREKKQSKIAIPKSSKRTNNSSQDEVDYWVAKGELPKDRELRQKVVNAKIKKETSKGVFYNS